MPSTWPAAAHRMGAVWRHLRLPRGRVRATVLRQCAVARCCVPFHVLLRGSEPTLGTCVAHCLLLSCTQIFSLAQFWQCRNEQQSSCPSTPSPTATPSVEPRSELVPVFSTEPTPASPALGARPPSAPAPGPAASTPGALAPIVVPSWAQYVDMPAPCCHPTFIILLGAAASTSLTRAPAGLRSTPHGPTTSAEPLGFAATLSHLPLYAFQLHRRAIAESVLRLDCVETVFRPCSIAHTLNCPSHSFGNAGETDRRFVQGFRHQRPLPCLPLPPLPPPQHPCSHQPQCQPRLLFWCQAHCCSCFLPHQCRCLPLCPPLARKQTSQQLPQCLPQSTPPASALSPPLPRSQRLCFLPPSCLSSTYPTAPYPAPPLPLRLTYPNPSWAPLCPAQHPPPGPPPSSSHTPTEPSSAP